MTTILPTLFLGCADDVPFAHAAGITRILTLCEACVYSEVILLHRPIPDEVWLSPDIWEQLVEELADLLRHGHTVLVHCRLGVSRSPALVAAYLATYQGWELEEARAMLKLERPVVKIHQETWRGVAEWAEGKKHE